MARAFSRSFVAVLSALALLAVAHPALAQQTAKLRGKVVDDTGKGVPDVEILFTYLGDIDLEYTAHTDSKGEFTKVGLKPGKYSLSAKKGDLKGRVSLVQVLLDETINTFTTITIVKGGPAGGNVKEVSNLSPEEVAKRNKEQAAIKDKLDKAAASIDAGTDLDAAIADIKSVAVTVPTCYPCSMKVGEAYQKEGDKATDDAAKKAAYGNAEASFKEAMGFDATKPDAYMSLASLYNTEKRLDEAAQMGAKANQLSASSATGGDPTSYFNQGVILWNQSKAAEAQVQFAQAVKLDPKMADAQYFLGMTLVNQNKLADAKAPFLEYMKLAPTGQYADQVKGLLAIIK